MISKAAIPVIVMASITLYAGIHQLYIYFRGKRNRQDLTFGLVCIALTLYDALCAGLYNAGTSSEGVVWQRGQFLALSLVIITFLWFLSDYTSVMPAFLKYCFISFYFLAFIIQGLDRTNMTWLSDQPSIKHIILPFGIKVTYNEVVPGIFTEFQSIMGLLVLGFIIWTTIRLFKSGQTKKATPLIIVISIFTLGALNDTAVNAGIYHFIYTMEYAYLGIVLIMMFSLANQALESGSIKEALRISEERLSSALDAANEGLFDWNFKTKGTYFSPRFFFLLGYEPDDLPASYNTWKNLLIPEDVEKFDQLISEYQERKRTNHEIELRMKTQAGKIHWILSRGKIVEWDIDGTPVRMVGTYIEITERRLVEDEIRTLNEMLEQRVKERTSQLETANKELEAFSYSVSHDLRAPLRAIDGFSRILIEDYAPFMNIETERYLKIIQDNAQQMGHLIDDLLAFSRLSRQPLKKQVINTVDLVHIAYEDLTSERGDRLIKFIVGELPNSQGDHALLKQVWINLISNAIKFTRNQENAIIEVGCNYKEGVQTFFIKDNGVGFDMQYADKVFGVFQRLHRSDEYEGTGVGLAIVQRIINRHGGQIWVEAQPGNGATFYFTL